MRKLAFALTVLACEAPRAETECPEALKLGYHGPGMVPCWEAAAHDRAIEFRRAQHLSGFSCPTGTHITCSGMTSGGTPVQFECDGHRCSFIPEWLW